MTHKEFSDLYDNTISSGETHLTVTQRCLSGLDSYGWVSRNNENKNNRCFIH